MSLYPAEAPLLPKLHSPQVLSQNRQVFPHPKFSTRDTTADIGLVQMELISRHIVSAPLSAADLASKVLKRDICGKMAANLLIPCRAFVCLLLQIFKTWLQLRTRLKGLFTLGSFLIAVVQDAWFVL